MSKTPYAKVPLPSLSGWQENHRPGVFLADGTNYIQSCNILNYKHLSMKDVARDSLARYLHISRYYGLEPVKN
jgi:hypothetical protein